MSQNTGSDVGHRLFDEIPRILKLWDEQVRVALPSTRNLNKLTLTNSLPVFLKMLSESLVYGVNLTKEHDAKDISKEHGEHRSRIPGYSISQIFIEYDILRKAVFEVLECETQVGKRERDLIFDFIAKAKDDAGAEYVSLRPVETVSHTEELTKIFLQAPIAICVLDGPDHIFTFANPIYEELVKRDVIGKKVRDVFTEFEVGPFFKLLDSVYETGSPYRGKEMSAFLEADNQTQEKFIDFSYHPLLDFQGRIKSILAIHIDVTEKVMVRKENELAAKKLASEQLRLSTILAQSPGAVAVFVGPDHVFELANQIYLSLFFGGRDDLLGRAVRDAVPEAEEQGFVALLDRVYQTGEPCTGTEAPVDLRQYDSTMKSFYINFVYQPLFDTEGKIEGIIAVVTDVTAFVLTKKALEKSNQDLLAQRDLRVQFVSTLSHDLRTPLAAAKMSAQLLVRDMSDPLKLQMISAKITQSLDRADKMIRDLLDVGQINAGTKMSLNL